MPGFTDPREASGTPQETRGAVGSAAGSIESLLEGGLPGLFSALSEMFSSEQSGTSDVSSATRSATATAGVGGLGNTLSSLFGQAAVPAGEQAAAGISRLQEAQAPFQTRALEEGVAQTVSSAGDFGTRFGRNASDAASRTVGEVTQGFDLNAANAFTQLFQSSQGLQGQALGAGSGLAGTLGQIGLGTAGLDKQLAPEQQAAMQVLAQIFNFLKPGETVVGPSTADRLLGIL